MTKRISETPAKKEMKLDKMTLRMENDDLGLTVVDEKGNTVVWLNGIGTAVLKEWLKEFDPYDKWKTHHSVKDHLKRS